MGLDMYLSKRTYVKNWSFQKDKEKHKVTIKLDGKVRKDIKPSRVTYVVEEVAYWRKANHIHNWFVQNCQGGVDECQTSDVQLEQLEELRDACQTALDNKGNEEAVENALPTASGFFFGGTEYDEYYYNDCQETIDFINAILKEEENKPEGCYGGEYEYRASW
jgi:hypothetical protein